MKIVKARDVEPGYVFEYAVSGNSLLQQTQFIKLRGSQNVVNVANWVAANVNDDENVVVLGRLTIETGLID